MELQNDTPFAALPLRLELSDTDIQGVLVVKSSFVRERDRWSPAAEQLPMVGAKLDTPFGIFHSDGFIHKQGVDVCVLGTVQCAKPTRSAELTLQVGTESRALRVYGDRRWRRSATGLLASDPEPFEELPLSYTHAYGGTTEHDYETYVYPDNPLGRGYYLSERAAEGQLLPNIEEASGPRTTQWSDQTSVAGWGPYPQFWGLRARAGVVPPEDPTRQLLPRLLPSLNNNAHPALVFAGVSEHEPLVIRGMRPEERVVHLPKLRLTCALEVGTTRVSSEGRLDGVFYWLDQERLTLTHRLHYRYEYRKEERRRAHLSYTLSREGT